MGLGLISGALKIYKQKNKSREDVITRTRKEIQRRIEDMKKKLSELYKKYSEHEKKIPEFAREIDPTLVGLRMQINDLTEKIAREEERLRFII